MVKKEETTKPVKKAPAKVAAPKKPRAVKKTDAVEAKAEVKTSPAKKHTASGGKYVFATGRRKTSIANVRLFAGSGENTVNKKPFDKYFFTSTTRDFALKPLTLVGMQNDYYFYATINGGGMNSQAHALQHGIAQALSKSNIELRGQLKKNSMLTRDDRKKERKKPGLKGARRSPQWAKR